MLTTSALTIAALVGLATPSDADTNDTNDTHSAHETNDASNANDLDAHIVVGGQLALSGMIALPTPIPIPIAHVRPFVALHLGRLTLHVDAALEPGPLISGVSTSAAALYAIDANDEGRFEIGGGVNGGLYLTLFVEDGGGAAPPRMRL